ncbi:MAG: hypothetical protein K6C32_03825 [Bacilli bacterium]|nr:hypothetical protein [Bacilli bacterium]
MKMSKKLIIPALSTAIGISLAAGIGGAVAWYQYNSQVTASFVGSSVADTGVLQIGYKTIDNKGTPDDTSDDVEVMHWGKDFVQSGDAAKLVPVTFGQLGTNNALPSKAYAYPEAGCGTGYEADATNKKPGWVEATEGKEYAQFELYFRALEPDKTVTTGDLKGYKLVERNVFLSDFICENTEQNKVADEALRIHVAPESQNANLYSKTAVTDLPLYGNLDLDRSGDSDKAVTTAFRDLKSYGVDTSGDAVYSEGDAIVYGKDGDKQSTKALSAIKQERDSNGKMPTSSDTTNFAKKVLTTSASGEVKVTITIWLEGWALLNNGTENSNIWNPAVSETGVKVGLQFDTGIFRGNDLNSAA